VVIASSPAWGEGADQSAQSTGLDEVVVTATRRQERLQDVPISATAFTSDKLEALGLHSIDDLSRVAPGVTFQRDGTGNNGNLNDEDSNINIRGVDSSAGTSTVGIYIDDTPIQGRHLTFTSFNAFPALFDLERVEVLRGPQGTLFGAGSEGGTVRFIQPTPDLQNYTAYSRAEFASTTGGAPDYEVGAAVGGPLIDGRLGFRVSVSDREDGGWVNRVDGKTGLVTDKNSISERTLVLRGALKWAPTDSLSITPSLYYQELTLKDTSAFWQNLSDPGNGEFSNGNSQPDRSKDPFLLGAVKVEWTGSHVQLTSNTAVYSRHQSSTEDFTDFDWIIYGLSPGGSSRPAGDLSTSIDTDVQRNFYQEIRVQSVDSAAAIVWSGGIFYAHLDEDATEIAIDPNLNSEYIAAYGSPLCTAQAPCPGGQILTQPVFRVIDSQYAAFGDATLKLSDAWQFTTGLRVAELDYRGNLDNYGPFIAPDVGPTSPLDIIGSGGDKQITPKFVLSFKPDSQDLVYASAAKGYRGGGLNGGISDFCASDLAQLGLAATPRQYNADSLWSYELGAKDNLADGRLQVNASVYFINWKNIQQAVYLPDCSQSFVANLGAATSRGGEVEMQGKPMPSLLLSFSAAYLDAKYSKTVCAGPTSCTGVDASASPIVTAGDHLPGAPWTVLMGGEYSLGDAYARLNYHLSTAPNGLEPNQDTNNGVSDPTYIDLARISTLDARAGIRLHGLDLSLFGQNLTDSHPIVFRNRFTTDSDLFFEHSIRPRTVGVTLAYRY